jgi:hypothetical protein
LQEETADTEKNHREETTTVTPPNLHATVAAQQAPHCHPNPHAQPQLSVNPAATTKRTGKEE